MFGGFNGSECQSCPMDTGNTDGGFTADSCECIAGYTAISDETCARKSLSYCDTLHVAPLYSLQ